MARRLEPTPLALAATERSVTLTAEPALRGSRLLHAAVLARDLGRGDVVRRLVAAARPLPLRETDQVQAAWLEQTVDPALSDDPQGLRVQADLADRAGRAGRAGDSDLALRIHTNRQIGRRLSVSHRTVATHLYRIFPKLGISSRAQIREALGDSPDSLPPAAGS